MTKLNFAKYKFILNTNKRISKIINVSKSKYVGELLTKEKV